MRWTKEAEETLWATIFKTQAFHLDLTEISNQWPGDDKPTPKALKEHLSKYRKGLGADNKITFGMGKKGGDSAVSTPVGTPKKRAAAKPKKGGDRAQAQENETPKKGVGSPLKKAVEDDGVVVKEEDEEGVTEEEEEEMFGTPSKKVKVEDADEEFC